MLARDGRMSAAFRGSDGDQRANAPVLVRLRVRGPEVSEPWLVVVGRVQPRVAQRTVSQFSDLRSVHPMPAASALDDTRGAPEHAGAVLGAMQASRLLLGEDGSTGGDAEGQPVVATGARYAPVVHPLVALRAGHHPRRRVARLIPSEDPQRQVGELRSHLLVDVAGGFQLDERLRALHEELIVVRGQGDDRINRLRVQNIFVVGQAQRGLHCLLVVTLVQLTLSHQVQVESLATAPWALQGSVAGHTLVRGDQALHCLRGGHRAVRGPGHLRVHGLRLELFDLQCSQQVQLLDPVGVLLRTTGHLFCHLGEQLRSLRVAIGLSVQLHGLDFLVLV
mmetsp:Transcript_22749/g.63662  ORF Transcript_22749/g.63662 Transcript_22749/m.63662 type:complete len:336 (-) Transcript_22749:699-1706(-)